MIFKAYLTVNHGESISLHINMLSNQGAVILKQQLPGQTVTSNYDLFTRGKTSRDVCIPLNYNTEKQASDRDNVTEMESVEVLLL